MAATTPEEALEWEARQGPRAGIASALGALLVIGSGVATAAVFNGAPTSGFADSLARAGREGGIGSLQSLRVPYYEFYDDRAFAVLMTAVARGLGFIAIGLMLAYLGTRGARAQRRRSATSGSTSRSPAGRSARSRPCCSRSGRPRRSPTS